MNDLLAIDAGTTGVRALVVDASGRIVDLSYRELAQSYPRPGWVEHDAAEIWAHVVATINEVVSRRDPAAGPLAAVGITNQRETVVAWDRSDGNVPCPAPVWQDKRTAPRCGSLRDAGHSEEVRRRTGLIIDPYFSATKMSWLLESGVLDGTHELALGTVDSWIAWNLTGAMSSGAFVTDPSNASRTLLYDIDERGWSDELCSLFGVPVAHLAEVVPSCGRVGLVDHASIPALRGVPVSGILGDQQAALFGQCCFWPGMIKATYGTGAFVLSMMGPQRPPVAEGLLTTVAWDLGAHGDFAYALEGSAFIAGAAVQWLRDELGIIPEAAALEPLARQVPDSGGLTFIPAFVGLGSPWWDETARGALGGITRGSTRAHLANAVVDSLAFEVRAITDAMGVAAGRPLTELRADGGAAAMDLLLERQANQSRIPVARPTTLESTATGAAMIAGLAEGVFGSLDELSGRWGLDASFAVTQDPETADAAYGGWLAMLERTRGWT